MPTPALTNPPAAPRNWKKIGLIALAVAVILALLVGSFALGGRVNNAPSTPTSTEEPAASNEEPVTGCQIPTQILQGYRFNPITCAWETDPDYVPATFVPNPRLNRPAIQAQPTRPRSLGVPQELLRKRFKRL